MNDADDPVRMKVLTALLAVAPELDVTILDPQVNFRDQMDFDSMDFMHFAIGLHQAFGVDIPERDYPRLFSLDGCIRYFSTRSGVRAS